MSRQDLIDCALEAAQKPARRAEDRTPIHRFASVLLGEIEADRFCDSLANANVRALLRAALADKEPLVEQLSSRVLAILGHEHVALRTAANAQLLVRWILLGTSLIPIPSNAQAIDRLSTSIVDALLAVEPEPAGTTGS